MAVTVSTVQITDTARTTVVIAVWDDYAGARLDEAIASILAQDVPARLLVVDNASAVPVTVAADAELVRTSQRLSLGAARNFGLERVRTPYAMVWDADDTMFPATLGRLEAALDADPALVAYGAAIVEDPTGLRHRWPRAWIARLAARPGLFAVAHSVWSLFPTTGATIMRTQAARDAGGYGSGDSGEDWVLGVSLVFRGRVGWSEQPGRLYRLHRTSVWAGHADVAHQLLHAREVRRRIWSDKEIPSAVRASVPLLALAQYAAIVLHVGVDVRRRIGATRNPDGDAGRR